LAVDQQNAFDRYARATLLGEVPDSAPPKGYQERKVAILCTYPGCDSQPSDDCNECPKHARASRKRARRRRIKNRRIWTAKKLCLRCGRKRRRGSKWCHRCLVKLGKLRDLDRHKQHHNSEDRVTREVEGDGYARTRRHGQPRRGQQPWHQLDDQDLVDAIDRLMRTRQGLALAASAEVAQLPRVQRQEIKNAAYAHAAHAKRFVAEVLERGNYDDGSDDEMGVSVGKTPR
jgi:hypothetical protein